MSTTSSLSQSMLLEGYRRRDIQTELQWYCGNCRVCDRCVFSNDEDNSTSAIAHSSTACRLLLRNGAISIQDGSGNLQGSLQGNLRGRNQNEVSARLRSIPPLLNSITRDTWAADFEAAKQKYLDKSHVATAKNWNLTKAASRFAHQEQTREKYEVRTAMACKRCFNRKQECRIDHLDCYRWSIKNNVEPVSCLDCRCATCRYDGGSTVACNAQ